MANVNGTDTTKRQASKKEVSAAPPNQVPKTRLISCTKMEVRQKEVDVKRQRIRQTYSKGAAKPKHKSRTFVTKVQIKSKKTAFENDKERYRVKLNDETSRVSEEQTSQSQQESGSEEIPTINTARLFQKNRTITSSGDSIDLLWADNCSAEQEKLEYLEINKLIRVLSKRQRESSALWKIPQRPTASFSRPTKGEMKLWIRNPANKINANYKTSFQTKPDFGRLRERAWSLPVCRSYSPSVERRPKKKLSS